MKKFIAAALALITMLSFAGCGGTDRIRGSVSSDKTPAKTRVPLDTIVPDEPSETTGVADHETEAVPVYTEPETEAAPSQADVSFELGTVRGNKYENHFIGIGCVLGSEWNFYSDEEIRQLNNIISDILGDEYAELMEQADIVYDMYAMNKNGTDSININMEKVNPLQLLMLDINENYKKLAPEMIKLYEDIGYTNISYTLENTTISGVDFPYMKVTATLNGVKAYFVSMSIKCNGYLANVTIGTFYTDYTDDIIAKFYLT